MVVCLLEKEEETTQMIENQGRTMFRGDMGTFNDGLNCCEKTNLYEGCK